MATKADMQDLIEAKKIEISRLASQIHDLMRRRETEIRELAALQMSISPIGKLPTELLAEIFCYLTDPDYSYGDDETTPIIVAVLCLSQVCHYWRQIAHATPRLWVDGFRLDVSRTPTELDLAQTTAWLERSHPLPITVSFLQSHLRETFSENCILMALFAAAGRWKHLTWDIPSLSPLLDLPLGPLEALETFHSPQSGTSAPKRVLDIFLTSPRLRVVDMNVDPRFFHLPWDQLTFLNLGPGSTLTLNACREIVLQCTHIVSITLRSYEWDFSDSEGTATSAIVVLPYLRHLVISFDVLDQNTMSSVEPFFTPLALPVLNILDLTFNISVGVNFIWNATNFAEFQARAPNIEKIALRLGRSEFATSADSLIVLLRNSPSVTDLILRLYGNGIDNTFFRALQFHASDSRPLVPRLKRLALLAMGSLASDNALVAMIQSRWWPDSASSLPGIARLEKVLLTGNYGRQGLQTKVREWQQQGLYINLG